MSLRSRIVWPIALAAFIGGLIVAGVFASNLIAGADDLLAEAADGTEAAHPILPAAPTPLPTGGLSSPEGIQAQAALADVEALEGVAAAQLVDGSSLVPALEQSAGDYSDGFCREPNTPAHMSYSFHIEVEMEPGASADQAGAVPVAIAREVDRAELDLQLTLPAAEGRTGAAVHYAATGDDIPLEKATAIAQGVLTIAAAPGVTDQVRASIPYTLCVECGALTVFVGHGSLSEVRNVIDSTIFSGTTLHGSFNNGAKP